MAMAMRELGDLLRGPGDVEVVLDSEAAYADGAPVRIHVRRRSGRIDIDDLGEAAARAPRDPGWLGVAERSVEMDSLNVNRRGVVFVQASATGRALRLAPRIAEASRRLELDLLGAG
jgi:hypothetical protein